MENVITLLREEHDRIRNVFYRWDRLGPEAMQEKVDIVSDLYQELQVHVGVLREVVLPELRTLTDNSLNFMLDQSVVDYERHLEVINSFRQRSPKASSYDHDFFEIRNGLESQLKEEETQILPFSELLVTGRFEDFSLRVHKKRAELRSQVVQKAA